MIKLLWVNPLQIQHISLFNYFCFINYLMLSDCWNRRLHFLLHLWVLLRPSTDSACRRLRCSSCCSGWPGCCRWRCTNPSHGKFSPGTVRRHHSCECCLDRFARSCRIVETPFVWNLRLLCSSLRSGIGIEKYSNIGLQSFLHHLASIYFMNSLRSWMSANANDRYSTINIISRYGGHGSTTHPSYVPFIISDMYSFSWRISFVLFLSILLI